MNERTRLPRGPSLPSWLGAGLITLAGCGPSAGPSPEAGRSDAPSSTGLVAGAAEDVLDIPIGVPQGGFTSRMFPLSLPVDKRDAPYTTQFVPSAGVATRIPTKALWLQQGDQVMVMTKLDLIYAFDGLLFAIEDRITELTGVDVHNKVTLSTNHSHGSYGDHSQDGAMYLGGDQFNREIFDRMADQVAQTAFQAFLSRAPAAVGVGFDPQFDPRDKNEIFRDRRGENDTLLGVDGQPLGSSYKDPRLTLLRVDHTGGNSDPSDDVPVAAVFHFGMHGTVLDDDNWFLSTDAPGAVELKFQEQFSSPVVVMHLQGGGGDQSPAGSQEQWARLETIGEIAAPRIKALWSATATRGGGDVGLLMDTRSIHQDHDRMRVTREGTVDIHYAPYDKNLRPDNVVYNPDGSVASPIDEFNTFGGAGLCGSDVPVPGRLWGLDTTVYPYGSCAETEEILKLMELPILRYDLSWATVPLQSARQTVISAARITNVPVHTKGSTDVVSDFVMGFFPGEAVSLYSDTFRYRVEQRTGHEHSICVAYSQDHEGYLLTVEDWLAGGYEPSINQWGPIQGEYILEQAVGLVASLDGAPLPDGVVEDWPWEEDMFSLDPVEPDITTDAGTVPTSLPEYMFTRTGVMPTQAQPEAQISRVAGIASFVWYGGDPAVDMPDVTLEQRGSNGVWSEALKRSGRAVTDAGYEIFVAYTPDPLSSRQDQRHLYLAEWQAVTDQPSLDWMASLPLGQYRLRVDGRARVANGGAYPWATQDYTVYSDPFEVVAAALSVGASGTTTSLNLTASYPSAADGWRLLSMSANWDGPVALCGGGQSLVASVKVTNTTGSVVFSDTLVPFSAGGTTSSATIPLGGVPRGTYQVEITDVFGNRGSTLVEL